MSRDVTVVFNARDQWSCTDASLDLLRQNTPDDVPILAVLGGAPDDLRDLWQRDHGGRVEFVWVDRYLNQAEARNMALRRIETPLAAVIDNDTFTRPGWLEPLLECQRETGAVCVVPTVLERPRQIHCIGCDLYITTDAGKQFGHKVLRFHGFPYADGCNQERKSTDYGELHCMLVEVGPTLELDAFDENIREVGEVDNGLVYREAGRELYVEPRSVVHFVEDAPLHARDLDFFTWRWDMQGVLDGYQHFERKWGFDITEHGNFKHFLYQRNARVGPLTRALRSEATFKLENLVSGATWKFRRLLRLPDEAWFKLRARQLRYDVWPEYPEHARNKAQGHPRLH